MAEDAKPKDLVLSYLVSTSGTSHADTLMRALAQGYRVIDATSVPSTTTAIVVVTVILTLEGETTHYRGRRKLVEGVAIP